MPRSPKFVLNVTLNDSSMQDQHDVAEALRRVADKLNKYVSTNWGPYATEGKVLDRDDKVVGTWEVKGPYDDAED